MKRDLRIVFMGTPEFAVGVLEKIISAGIEVAAVVTAPDRPAGRGRKTTPSAVKIFAEEKNVPVLQPTNLKDEEFITELRSYHANVFVVVAFRMLPKVVWELPEYGTFNLHASLLPDYRGAAPINWAIINGEQKTGVTTFFIDEKIDTGAIILKDEVAITPSETASTLHDKLMHLGAELVVKTLKMISQDAVNPEVQQDMPVLKEAPKLTQENTKIDWQKSGVEIERLIRGLSSFPTAWTFLTNKGEEMRVKIFSASFEPTSVSAESGRIFQGKDDLKVHLKDGILEIKELQLPGKRKMEIKDLLNGYSFSEDARVY